MVRSFLFFILIISLFHKAYAQENDIQFLKQKIIVDYPGFSEKTNPKDFNRLVDEVAARYNADTFKALSAIVRFFNDQHLQVYTFKKWIKIDTNECNNNFNYIKKYLRTTKRYKALEGYWVNDYNDCIIGLKQEKMHPLTYMAYVIENTNGKLLPGMVLGKFEQMPDGIFFTDYYSPYSGGRYFLNTVFRNDSIFTTGADGKWRQIKTYTDSTLHTLKQFSYRALGKKLDINTYYLAIPGSSKENIRIIDSIVKSQSEEIGNCANLIIDIRNNLGGSVRVYEPLIPFIYTNPIVKVRIYSFCTQDNVQNSKKRLDAYIKEGKIDSAFLAEWKEGIKLEEDSVGKFVLNDFDTLKCALVKANPRNVGLIINYACQSAAEMMILDLRQSRKVTVFGEHTMGAIDYLDYYPMELPSGKYKLYMPTSKRVIPPGEQPIDGKGIYPDIQIADSELDWANYVHQYYKNQR